MHHVFQHFIDGLAESADTTDLRKVLSAAGAALDLSCFAYIALPCRRRDRPLLISTYPVSWTDHYLMNHYEKIDPVIVEALTGPEPFEWGSGRSSRSLTRLQQQFFEEATQFGIRCGLRFRFTIRVALLRAVTFAADEHRPAFQRCIESNKRVLQLMAMYFHAHARRKLAPQGIVDGVSLSPRELECLEWAAQGKSAWDIGQLLNISRRTAAFHLDNAKTKFGVRTICQAVAKLVACKSGNN